MTSMYTVEIQAGNEDGTIWQAVAPAENINTAGWGPNWTAEDLAKTTADEQTVADGANWRVRVWHGYDADTAAEPAAEIVVSQTYTTLGDLAAELAEKYGDDRSEALDAVTSYANDLGVDTGVQSGRGGQAPDVLVDAENAEHIAYAYGAGRKL